MPLFNGKQVAPAPELSPFAYPAEVFQIRLTKEIFASYEEYVTRLMFYRQHKFTCEATGNSNLTFAEALESEKVYFRNNKDTLPSSMRRAALMLIHLNHKSLLEVVDQIYDYFAQNVLVNEIVYLLLENSQKLAKVVEIVHSDDDPSKPLYRVRLLDKEYSLLKGDDSEHLVPIDQIKRLKRFFSKVILKNFVPYCAHREGYCGAPWSVKTFFLNAYNIPLNPHFGKAKAEQPTITIKLRLPTPTLAEAKFPMDDLTLLKIAPPESVEADQKLPTWPVPSTGFENIPEEANSALIKSFNFLNVFGENLSLTPFTMDEFIKELSSNRPSVLLWEIFGCLMNISCREWGARSNSSANPLEFHYTYLRRSSPPDNSIFATDPRPVSDLTKDFIEFLKGMSVNERTCIDQWWKWIPGRWATGYEANQYARIPDYTRFKAWQIVLVGLMKDWMEENYIPEKWELMMKILGIHEASQVKFDEVKREMFEKKEEVVEPVNTTTPAPPVVEEEEEDQEQDQLKSDDESPVAENIEVDELQEDVEMQADDDFTPEEEPRQESNDSIVNSRLRDRKKKSDFHEEASFLFEDEYSGRLRKRVKVGEADISSQSIKVDSTAHSEEPEEQIEEPLEKTVERLAYITETNFNHLSPHERLFVLEFMLETCIIPSDLIRWSFDTSIERAAEIRKEIRECIKDIKAAVETRKEYERETGVRLITLDDGSNSTRPVQNYGEEEEEVFDQPKEHIKKIISAKTYIEKLQSNPSKKEEQDRLRKEQFESATKDQKQILEKLKKMEEQERGLERKKYSLEQDLVQVNARCVMKPLGMDRWYNRYWFVDAACGRAPLEERGRGRPRLTDKSMYWSTGKIFVEMFGLQDVENPLDPEYEDFRNIGVPAKWGYYSEPSQIDKLFGFLDNRGVRELQLIKSLENLAEDIAVAMHKREEDIKDGKGGEYVNKLAK